MAQIQSVSSLPTPNPNPNSNPVDVPRRENELGYEVIPRPSEESSAEESRTLANQPGLAASTSIEKSNNNITDENEKIEIVEKDNAEQVTDAIANVHISEPINTASFVAQVETDAETISSDSDSDSGSEHEVEIRVEDENGPRMMRVVFIKGGRHEKYSVSGVRGEKTFRYGSTGCEGRHRHQGHTHGHSHLGRRGHHGKHRGKGYKGKRNSSPPPFDKLRFAPRPLAPHPHPFFHHHRMRGFPMPGRLTPPPVPRDEGPQTDLPPPPPAPGTSRPHPPPGLEGDVPPPPPGFGRRACTMPGSLPLLGGLSFGDRDHGGFGRHHGSRGFGHHPHGPGGIRSGRGEFAPSKGPDSPFSNSPEDTFVPRGPHHRGRGRGFPPYPPFFDIEIPDGVDVADFDIEAELAQAFAAHHESRRATRTAPRISTTSSDEDAAFGTCGPHEHHRFDGRGRGHGHGRGRRAHGLGHGFGASKSHRGPGGFRGSDFERFPDHADRPRHGHCDHHGFGGFGHHDRHHPFHRGGFRFDSYQDAERSAPV